MDPIKRIYRKIKNDMRSALPYVAYAIGDKMQNAYTDCVTAFYNHREESDNYYRGYNTYLGSSMTYEYGEKTSGNYDSKDGEVTTFVVKVHMNIDPSYLGSPYKDPVDYVFERTWSQGIHGTLANPQMEEPPQAKFEKWLEKFKGGEHKRIARMTMRKHTGIG